MAQSCPIELTGVLSGTPAFCSAFSSSLQELLPLNFCDVYASLKSTVLSGITGSAGAPVPIPFESITKARVIAVRVVAGTTINLRITTAQGLAIIPVSDLFLLRARNPGDEVLSISIDSSSQQVDVAYLIAGDIS